MTYPDPPPWPWWPITTTTLLVAVAIYLYHRAARNSRSVAVRSGIVAALIVLFPLPALYVMVAHATSCNDNGYTTGGGSESSGGMLLLLGGTLVGAVWLLTLAAGEPPGRSWRLPAMLIGGIAVGLLVEGMISFGGLSSYCDGSASVLQQQVGAAIIVPLVVGLGLAWRVRGHRDPDAG